MVRSAPASSAAAWGRKVVVMEGGGVVGGMDGHGRASSLL
jgi:hypothetical protein